MSESTGDYHVKIEKYVEKIGSTEDLPTINTILQDLISDTKEPCTWIWCARMRIC